MYTQFVWCCYIQSFSYWLFIPTPAYTLFIKYSLKIIILWFLWVLVGAWKNKWRATTLCLYNYELFFLFRLFFCSFHLYLCIQSTHDKFLRLKTHEMVSSRNQTDRMKFNDMITKNWNENCDNLRVSLYFAEEMKKIYPLETKNYSTVTWLVK